MIIKHLMKMRYDLLVSVVCGRRMCLGFWVNSTLGTLEFWAVLSATESHNCDKYNRRLHQQRCDFKPLTFSKIRTGKFRSLSFTLYSSWNSYLLANFNVGLAFYCRQVVNPSKSRISSG